MVEFCGRFLKGSGLDYPGFSYLLMERTGINLFLICVSLPLIINDSNLKLQKTSRSCVKAHEGSTLLERLSY